MGKTEIPVMQAVPVGSDISGLANPTYKGIPAYTGAWKDCAYDPELPGPIYHADQVRVPSNLQDVVREWTKAVVRENPKPEELNEWSLKWFQSQVAAQEPPPRCRTARLLAGIHHMDPSRKTTAPEDGFSDRRRSSYLSNR